MDFERASGAIIANKKGLTRASKNRRTSTYFFCVFPKNHIFWLDISQLYDILYDDSHKFNDDVL